MTVTIAKYRDRIPTDKTAAEAASIHGAGSVFVDGKCYADILAEQAKPAEEVAEAAADEAPPGAQQSGDPQPETAAPAVAAAEGAGE